eukprot:29494-Pelagococcus_subviridis.AAC.3
MPRCDWSGGAKIPAGGAKIARAAPAWNLTIFARAISLKIVRIGEPCTRWETFRTSSLAGNTPTRTKTASKTTRIAPTNAPFAPATGHPPRVSPNASAPVALSGRERACAARRARRRRRRRRSFRKDCPFARRILLAAAAAAAAWPLAAGQRALRARGG